ncbi:MAG: hypothetical protein F6K41_19835 [Symploca sp. SIO3E6]|nr:hypothetical protein [Caldora sp. SIO3E6]
MKQLVIRKEGSPDEKIFSPPCMKVHLSASLSNQTPMNFHLTMTDENFFVSASPRLRVYFQIRRL